MFILPCCLYANLFIFIIPAALFAVNTVNIVDILTTTTTTIIIIIIIIHICNTYTMVFLLLS